LQVAEALVADAIGILVEHEEFVLETGLRAEIKALDNRLSARIDKLEEGKALISARLTVVESHVLGALTVPQPGTDADARL